MNPTTTLSLDCGGNYAYSSKPVHASRMRETNVENLLRLLRDHSPCSRADLVRLSGLTAPTVSAGIRTLQRQDLATSLGQGSSNGGRPPGLLEFNARHGYVVGVDVGGTSLRLALADLNGAVVGRWSSVLRTERSPKAVIDLIASGITHLSRQQKVPPKKILQIGAGAPGATDATAGRVLSAPNLTAWNDVPFRDLIEGKTGIAAAVENDVNLGALGEGWCGAARNVADFIFLAIGTGIGAGVVLNRTLHHGANWSAGEVGYMLLPGLPDEPPRTDQPGSLESAIGGASIERAWASSPSSGQSETLRATDVFDLAAAGDRRGRELLHRAAEQVAMAITNLSLVLDLSLVVLSGGVGGHPSLLEAIQKKLERNQFARPRLVTSNLGGEAQLYGAVWLALQAAEARGFRREAIEIENKGTRGRTLVESF
jgi:glucokinase